MPLAFGAGGFGWGFFSADDLLAFDDLTLYYIALLIVQYVTKPRARATVGIWAREFVAQSVDEAVRDGFDITTAVGIQVDILASYRGALRNVFGIGLTQQFYSYAFYSDPDPTIYQGYALYTDPSITWYFLTYGGGGAPTYSMQDDQLRRLTEFLAQTHSNFLSLMELDIILFNFFGNNLQLSDNQDMSITYTYNFADTDTLYTIVKNSGNLPAPAGVLVNAN